MYIFSHDGRSYRILVALQDKRFRSQLVQIRAIVGEECDAGEVLGMDRVRFAKALFQLLRKLGMFGVSHNDGRHHGGPSGMVIVQHLKQVFDVGSLEAPDVLSIVDVAGGGADHHNTLEELRTFDCGKRADHRTHGVPNENHRSEAQLVNDLDHVSSVTVQGAVSRSVKRGGIGIP